MTKEIIEMPIQTIFSSIQLAEMSQRLESNPLVERIYSNGESYTEPKNSQRLTTLIEVAEKAPELVIGSSRANNEAENAIKVYEYLKPLSRTQAADSRLWTTLTHTTFWIYCQKRWPVENQSSSFIFEHWFEKRGAGLGALRRNAISRLWWAAHLTVAPWEADPELLHLKSSDRYKFTRTLLSQAQIFQDVIEREYGSNLRLRILLLSAFGKHAPRVSNKDNLSKSTSIQLLLELKNRHLEVLPVSAAGQIINDIVERAAKRQLPA